MDNVNSRCYVIYAYVSLALLFLLLVMCEYTDKHHDSSLTLTQQYTLHIRVFEIVFGEIYIFYFTAQALVFNTRRHIPMHVWIYAYQILSEFVTEKGTYVLMAICACASAANCAFMLYFIANDCYFTPDSCHAIEFVNFIMERVEYLRATTCNALYFLWIRNLYGLVFFSHESCSKTVCVLFLVGEIFKVFNNVPSGIWCYIEICLKSVSFITQVWTCTISETHRFTVCGIFSAMLIFGNIVLGLVSRTVTECVVHIYANCVHP